MEVDTSQFRNGLRFLLDGQPFVMTFFQHVKPGKGGAFVRTKIKNLVNGKVLERNFRSGERVELADVEEKKMQYLYLDGDNLVFMDQSTYDQTPFTKESVGEARLFLKENMEVEVLFWNDRPINMRPSNEMITVRPANSTARPLVSSESTIARSTSDPSWRLSR